MWVSFPSSYAKYRDESALEHVKACSGDGLRVLGDEVENVLAR